MNIEEVAVYGGAYGSAKMYVNSGGGNVSVRNRDGTDTKLDW